MGILLWVYGKTTELKESRKVTERPIAVKLQEKWKICKKNFTSSPPQLVLV